YDQPVHRLLTPAQQAAEGIARRQAAPAERAHQALHLAELLQDPVHIGWGGPAPARDASPPAGLDQLRMASLFSGHRVDDRLDAPQLAVVDGRLRRAGNLACARNHLHQLPDRSELLDLLQLAAEVLEAEARLHHSLRDALCFVAIEPLLHALD